MVDWSTPGSTSFSTCVIILFLECSIYYISYYSSMFPLPRCSLLLNDDYQSGWCLTHPIFTKISSHYESPQLKTVFLDLKRFDLKRFISRMGNLWPLAWVFGL